MPKQITEIKQFIEYARRQDATAARVKTSIVKPKASSTTASKKSKKSKGDNKVYKFKLRTSKNLYTLVLKDAAMAAKLKQSLPPGLEVSEIAPKN